MEDHENAHAEMWDDSALLSSWNEAFEEYKKYHSIAARGEKVKVEPQSLEINQDASAQVENVIHEDASGAPGTSSANNVNAQAHGDATASRPIGTSLPSTVTPTTLQGSLAVPQMVLASVQDENIKNLMMAWYYSGYYTGLYEGKQQGYALAKEHMAGG